MKTNFTSQRTILAAILGAAAIAASSTTASFGAGIIGAPQPYRINFTPKPIPANNIIGASLENLFHMVAPVHNVTSSPAPVIHPTVNVTPATYHAINPGLIHSNFTAPIAPVPVNHSIGASLENLFHMVVPVKNVTVTSSPAPVIHPTFNVTPATYHAINPGPIHSNFTAPVTPAPVNHSIGASLGNLFHMVVPVKNVTVTSSPAPVTHPTVNVVTGRFKTSHRRAQFRGSKPATEFSSYNA